MIPTRFTNLDEARVRFGDRVDRLAPYLLEMDPLADAAVEAIAEAGPGTWKVVDRGLARGVRAVPEAPEAVKALLAFSERVPPWVDWDVVDRGGRVLLRAGALGGTVLGAESLVFGYCSPAGNKPLVFSGRLRDQAPRRLNETARFVHATAQPGALVPPRPGAPSGEAYRITVKVRLMHAQVRRLIRRSGRWQAESWGEPINQHDMAATSLLFSAVVLDGLRKLGFAISDAEADDHMQLWRFSSHLTGVAPELNPASEREAVRLGDLIAATEAPPDEDSRELVRALMESAITEAKDEAGRERARRFVGFAYGMCRGLIGDELADQLDLPKNVWRHAVPTLRAVVRGLEAVRTRVPLADEVAVSIGNRYWAKVVDVGLAGIPAEFAAPEVLGLR